MTPTQEFRHLQPLRVPRLDMGVHGEVGASRMLAWIENAVDGYWRALALPYGQTMAHLGGRLQVSRATLTIEAAARHEDLLHIGLRSTVAPAAANAGAAGGSGAAGGAGGAGGAGNLVGAAVAFEVQCRRGEQTLARGELIMTFADAATGAARALPAALCAALQDFEAGKAMVEVRVDRWAALERDARPIRTAVFVDEQRIPAEMEWDAADSGCLHAVAYNRLGLALATGRLLEHVPGTAKIGRMAVLQAVRGSGIGAAVLQALMDAARTRGEREVLLHAQTSAMPFYLRAGFQPRGPQFDEAGIAHVEMVRGL